MSGCILHLYTLHSPVFLLNSCLDLFSAPHLREDPLFRRYGVNLPSSLAMNHSSALVYSTQPPVSVYGTGTRYLKLRGFSWELDYLRYPIARGRSVLSGSAFRRHFTRPNLPTPLNELFRQFAGVSLLRLPNRSTCSAGILTSSSIGFALRLILRSRLTLIRLALIRKPWSYGEEVFRLLYRYLYLHLLFPKLHITLSLCFYAAAMLPYQLQLNRNSTSSAPDLMPDYHPRAAARLVSCYALFK